MRTKTGFRKKTTSPAPPETGGFVVGRYFAALLAALAVAALALSLHAPFVKAQPSPAAAPGQDSKVKDLVTIDCEIDRVTARLNELEARSAALRERMRKMDGEIAARRDKLAARRKALAARVRSMYVNGGHSSLVVLMSSSGLEEFFRRSEYLDKVSRRDAELVTAVKAEATELEASVSRLKDSKAEVDRLASDLRSRGRRLAKSRAEKQALIASAGERAAQLQEQSQKVEARMEQLNPVPTGRPTGRFLVMMATAYSPEEPGLSHSTASGLRAQKGVVAVDPRVIPLGTRVHVEGYGNAIAGDTGSAIKGNRIDLCFDTLAECNAYGRRKVKVEILD